MKVAFRVDASAQIGSGHITRCLALAQALRAWGVSVTFVSRDLGVDVAAYVLAAGFEAVRLQPPAGGWTSGGQIPHASWAGVAQEIDAAETSSSLSHLSLDWMVVDHYAFDATWHRSVASELGCRMAAIDDLADRALDVAMLIDHNLAEDHHLKYRGRLNDQTVILGGPGYALLGPAYARATPLTVRDEVHSIGVFMGGTDVGGYSHMALAAINAMGFTGPVEVVSTRSNPGLQALQAAVAGRPNTALSVDLPDLAAFFARHDLQIGAGGGATWERCCIGAPTLAMVIAENQRCVLEPLEGMSVLVTSDETPPTVPSLARVLNMLMGDAARRRRLASGARRLVDGQGAKRVAERLCSP